MNDLILGVLGIGNEDIDINRIRDSGVVMIMEKHNFNLEQAMRIEESAFSLCNGNLIEYTSTLTNLGELLSLMANTNTSKGRFNR